MILRVLNLILIVITFGLVEIIDTVTYDEIDNNITVTGYEDYTYREVFGDSLYGVGKTNLMDNGNIEIDTDSNGITDNLSVSSFLGVTNVSTSNNTQYFESLALNWSSSMRNFDNYNHIDFKINNQYYISFTGKNIAMTEIAQNDVLLSYSVDGNFSIIYLNEDYARIYIYFISDLGLIAELSSIKIYGLTTIFEEENEPTIEQFETMLTEYERMLALQPYEQVTTTTNTLDMTDLMISLVSLLCWYGIIKVWKGVRK